MFISHNVRVLFKKATLKIVKDTSERVVEATFEVNHFTEALARELGEEIAGHVYTDDGKIRDEIDSFGLRVKIGKQIVTVRHHDELKPVAVIKGADIVGAVVSREEDQKHGTCWLSLTFTLVYSLAAKPAAEFTLTEFGNIVLLSFESVQRALEMEPEAVAATT